jgi:hypothetical protein
VTPDVLQSPALELLLRFEREGFEVAALDGRLFVRPVERLSSADREALRAMKPELLMLLRIVDEGVQRRREVFEVRLQAGGPAVVPDLVFRAGITPVAGRCVSCGDALDTPRMGKCWRCCLAWRLALRVPIPSTLAAIFDEARRIA